MQVKVFESGYYANTYAIIDGKNCLLIDMGCNYDQVKAELLREGITPLAVLFTHGHYDHIAGAKSSDIPLYILDKEVEFLSDPNLNLAYELGAVDFQPIKNVNLLTEGKTDICGFSVQVIHTAGHTKGSACYAFGEHLFSGDTIFNRSYGRYDFPTGSFTELKNSVVKVLDAVGENTIIYPGHGEKTTCEQEKKYNPLYQYAKNNQ